MMKNGYGNLPWQRITEEIKKHGESRGMQCSYVALMSVGWNLLKTISRYLDDISLNGNLLFESINKLR